MNVRFVVLVAILTPHLITAEGLADNALPGSLVFAAKQGDFAKAEQLIQTGVDIDGADEDRRSPLLWAAQGGHIEIVQMLIQNGADVDRVDNYGNTALRSTAD